jgi:hypothetical protein
LVDIQIIPARKLDAIRLARDLRIEDQVEMVAAFGDARWDDVLIDQVDNCDTASAVYFGGDIAAICGCDPSKANEAVGVPWMMGSKVLRKHPRLVCELTAEILQVWLEQYERLQNMVFEGAKANINFLRRCGFTVHESSHGYHLFEMSGVEVF